MITAFVQFTLPQPISREKAREAFLGSRITSYNVCYTKLLRIAQILEVGLELLKAFAA